MKKHTLKTSTISVLCVLCAGLTTNAMAAGSVRALGGAGTVNGTSTAATSTRTVSAPRAASLRVSPSSARLISSAPSGTTTSGTTSTGQRLSIGKYLGGATTASTGTTTSGGTSGEGESSNVGALEERIISLETTVNGPNNNPSAGLDDRVDALESQIESGVVAGDYTGTATGGVVEVTDGVVSVNIDALVDKLEAEGVISSAPKDIQYTSDHELQYRYLTGNDTGWHTWFDLDDITGNYTTLAQVNTAIDTALASASYATTEQLAAKQDKIDAEHKLPASNVSGLATVATTGAYSDLTGTPTIPDLPELATVATTGAYSDLTGTPNLGTMAAENKTSYYTKSEVDTALTGISGENGSIATQIDEALEDYTPTSGLATVATTGAYSDLTGTPNLGTMAAENKTSYYTKTEVDNTLNAMSGDSGSIATQINSALEDYTPTADLATVATSGSYNDLSNKPTIPSVDNALSKTSENPVQNKVVTGALPNFDTTNAVLLEPGEDGAYVLGVVNGQRAYIAVVDGNGQTGVPVSNP